MKLVFFMLQAFSELLPRKLAFVTGKLHPERDSFNAYIVYKEQSSVQQAITMNAQVFMEKHLRVDSVANPQVFFFFLSLLILYTFIILYIVHFFLIRIMTESELYSLEIYLLTRKRKSYGYILKVVGKSKMLES